MQACGADAFAAGGERRGRFSGTAVVLVALAVLGMAAYANSLANRALFHHVPNAYADPVLDNSMLRCRPLLPRIFTRDFLLATNGEYRPLGYALFAALNGLAPQGSYVAWHILLLGVHFVSAALVFAMLRMLARDVMAAGLAAAYLVHPVFVPLLNDVNSMYLLWGLLFTALTVWLYLAYLTRARVLYLALSILCFAASVFTYRHAVIAPVFLVVLCLFHERHPRSAAAMLVYAALAALLAGIWRLHPLITLAGLSALILIGAGASSLSRDRYAALAKTVPPYLVVVALFLLVSATMVPRPVFRMALKELEEGNLIAPLQPWFVGRQMLGGSVLRVFSLAVAALMPLAFLLRGRARTVAVAGALALMLCATVRSNPRYRDDVRYWQGVQRWCPGLPAVEVNLANAYLAHGEWERARDLLMRLRYERKVQGLLLDTANTGLGRAFAEMGNDKVAGFYHFPRGMAWRAKIMKNLITQCADFSFRLGYISVAEHFWACSLVLDPYDVRLYNNLGRALIYKNFFRAAAKHFRHVLSLQPRNASALYYQAFLAKLEGNEREYGIWRDRWQDVTGGRGEPDFQPVFDGFRFDREQARRWFSGRPLSLLQKEDVCRIILHGKEYVFWEVPLEVGKYYLSRSRYAEAGAHLSSAYELNPESQEAARLLVQVYRQLNRTRDAQRLQRVLEKVSDATQTK